MSISKLIDEQAEKAVVGCLFLNDTIAFNLLTEAGMKLDREWFTIPIHAEICQAALDLRMQNKPCDLITIPNLLKSRGFQLESHEIGQMCDMVGSAHAITAHAEIVRDLYLKRRQRDVFINAIENIEGEQTSQDVLATVRGELEGTEIMEQEKSSETIAENICKELDVTMKQGFSGLPSRWLPYQAKIGQYRKGKVYIVAARTSVGKTTYALNEVEFWLSKGYRVGFITLETSSEDIYEQATGIRENIDLFKMRDGFDQALVDKFKLGLAQTIKLPLYVNDKNMNIFQIKNWIMAQVYRNKLDAVVLDYIQIISDTAADRKKSSYDRVSNWSRELFEVAKKANVVMMALCQISRAGEPPHNVKQEDRWKYTPKLMHLKESGKLEEDAYAVTILYYDPLRYVEGTNMVPLVAEIAKHRRGPIGKIGLAYDKSKQRMEWSQTSQF